MAPELVSAAAPPAGVKAGGVKAGGVRTGGVRTVFTGDVINGKKVVSSLNTDDLELGRKLPRRWRMIPDSKRSGTTPQGSLEPSDPMSGHAGPKMIPEPDNDTALRA